LDWSLFINIYEFPGGKLVHSLPLDKSIFRNYSARPSLQKGTAISFSPDGKILASGYTNGFFILWNIESEQAVFVHQNAKSQWYNPAGDYSAVFGIRFSKDGTMLASESTDNSVAVWGIP
jgi:WD40 repeat protein